MGSDVVMSVGLVKVGQIGVSRVAFCEGLGVCVDQGYKAGWWLFTSCIWWVFSRGGRL